MTARAQSLIRDCDAPPDAVADRVVTEAGTSPARVGDCAPLRPAENRIQSRPDRGDSTGAQGRGTGGYSPRSVGAHPPCVTSHPHRSAGHLFTRPVERKSSGTPVAASPWMLPRPAGSGASTTRCEPWFPASLTAPAPAGSHGLVGGVLSVAAALIMASPVGSVIWWWGGRA